MKENDIKHSAADLSGKTKEDVFNFEKEVKGPDFDGCFTIEMLIKGYENMGIQGSCIYSAIKEIREMRKNNARIFLGFTSNMISCGIREIIMYLAKNKHVDVMCTTAGGIEEDIIKCMAPTYLASGFVQNDGLLRECGWNRIGNMVINNENYFLFEDFMRSFLDELVLGSNKYDEYNKKFNYINLSSEHSKLKNEENGNKIILTPSKLIYFLGKKINNQSSVLYWAYKNGIIVYSHAIVDGSFGDMVSFYNHREKLVIDISEDIKCLNWEPFGNEETKRKNGAIILGGGLIKHMILNANLFNNGLDYCVLINNGVEYEASDAGAALSEGMSWGKVKNGKGIKVYGEASIIFPLVAYGGFKMSWN
ncbi:DYS1 [Ecytonucleospora hepatopenaei]|uniref:deoxyhypusine synthase n=1 Tax=Ecytonucleospora hepatopenaei TaxID=646526 RepID=A0A1W0E8I4_9MICR|nr:DYS1 [Ecytonucleospora hepatopenaei]